jgi:hypothetical protein
MRRGGEQGEKGEGVHELYCENNVFQSFESHEPHDSQQRKSIYQMSQSQHRVRGRRRSADDVWMNGSLKTSSLNVYLILLYISSPREEKSRVMS